MSTDSSMHKTFYSENLKEIENLLDLGTQEYNVKTLEGRKSEDMH
jgi:hypothetical protein